MTKMKNSIDIDNLLFKAQRFDFLKSENQKSIDSLSKDIELKKEQYDKSIEIDKQLSDVFYNIKILSELISKTNIEQIETFVTGILKTVFFDRDFSFVVEVNEKRDAKNANFFLSETINGETYNTPLKASRLSGGVISVVGFSLQIYFINFFNLSPVVFVDEGFAAISDEYLPYFFSFLKTIKENFGFIIVLITHDERFMAEADKVYLVEDGTFTVV